MVKMVTPYELRPFRKLSYPKRRPRHGLPPIMDLCEGVSARGELLMCLDPELLEEYECNVFSTSVIGQKAKRWDLSTHAAFLRRCGDDRYVAVLLDDDAHNSREEHQINIHCFFNTGEPLWYAELTLASKGFYVRGICFFDILPPSSSNWITRVLVTIAEKSKIYVFDADTGAAKRSVEVGFQPTSIAVNDFDGLWYCCSNYGNVYGLRVVRSSARVVRELKPIINRTPWSSRALIVTVDQHGNVLVAMPHEKQVAIYPPLSNGIQGDDVIKDEPMARMELPLTPSCLLVDQRDRLIVGCTEDGEILVFQ